jgi:hypothetical protein
VVLVLVVGDVPQPSMLLKIISSTDILIYLQKLHLVTDTVKYVINISTW